MTDDETICWLSVREQAALVRERQLSATELVSLHLDRIGMVNPAINALVTLDPERSLREAALADQVVVSGQPLGPLHGVPAGFKDTHDTAGMRTTYGSPMFAGHVPATDDPVVARMRQAGAITLGKTNVPEFAAGGHTYNQVFGITRNPYDLTRSAGGSGGGSAAALATGLIPAAEGSDLGSSLRGPASFCNVVGLRPSPGRVPAGSGPFAWQSLMVRGPMGRTVDDVALILSVLSGPGPGSPARPDHPGEAFGRIRPADTCGLRVAWSPDLAGQAAIDPGVVEVLGRQLGTLVDLGCEVDTACIDFDEADEAFRTLRAWMFAYTMNDHVRNHRDKLKPSLVWNIEEGQFLSGRDVASALESQAALYERARRFFEAYDVLALPATPVTPFRADLEYPGAIARPAAGQLPRLARPRVLRHDDWLPPCGLDARRLHRGGPAGRHPVRRPVPGRGTALVHRDGLRGGDAVRGPAAGRGCPAAGGLGIRASRRRRPAGRVGPRAGGLSLNGTFPRAPMTSDRVDSYACRVGLLGRITHYSLRDASRACKREYGHGRRV
jgi:amidase